MPLQSQFPVSVSAALCKRIIQRPDIRTGHAQALIRLVDSHLLDCARRAVADADFRRASNMWTAAVHFDEHLCLVAVDTPGQARSVGELVAGSLVEGEDGR
jgi:hypothetical protein